MKEQFPEILFKKLGLLTTMQGLVGNEINGIKASEALIFEENIKLHSGSKSEHLTDVSVQLGNSDKYRLACIMCVFFPIGCSSSNSSSTTSLASNSPKTGSSDWAVPQSSRLKYRQQFNSLDKLMSGYLSGVCLVLWVYLHTVYLHVISY